MKSVMPLLLIFMTRCYDDGAHVDEELFPALGETNPLLKNKKVSTARLTNPVYVGVTVKVVIVNYFRPLFVKLCIVLILGY